MKLFEEIPNANVVALSINNSWKLVKFGQFPMGLGSKVRLEVQQPIENTGNLDELITQIEASVVSGINSFK